MSRVDEVVDRPLWTIYALGGGLGHVTRALSLARHAARRNVRTKVLSNSPFLSAFNNPQFYPLLKIDPLIEIVSISSELGRDAVSHVIRQQINLCRRSDVLVVDTFSRGIGGELVNGLSQIPAYKVFIHRDLNPDYIRQANVGASLSNYDLVLVPGEAAPLESMAHARTDIWTICDSDELLSPTHARSVFGLDVDDRLHLIVVSGTGRSDEAVDAARLALGLAIQFAGRANIRLASLDAAAIVEAGELGCSPWPLLMTLAGVDLLIGSGGYHSVYEARTTKTPLFAFARPRVYDRQANRLGPTERCSGNAELVSKVDQWLEVNPLAAVSRGISYRNGAFEAYQIISEGRDCDDRNSIATRAFVR